VIDVDMPSTPEEGAHSPSIIISCFFIFIIIIIIINSSSIHHHSSSSSSIHHHHHHHHLMFFHTFLSLFSSSSIFNEVGTEAQGLPKLPYLHTRNNLQFKFKNKRSVFYGEANLFTLVANRISNNLLSNPADTCS
jgi:hypothetical protein